MRETILQTMLDMGDNWYFEDGQYGEDVAEYRNGTSIYRERREAEEMRKAELAMTPTFPEFNLEEDKAHVG